MGYDVNYHGGTAQLYNAGTADECVTVTLPRFRVKCTTPQELWNLLTRAAKGDFVPETMRAYLDRGGSITHTETRKVASDKLKKASVDRLKKQLALLSSDELSALMES